MDSKGFFQDLFEQNHYFNEQIIAVLEKNQRVYLKNVLTNKSPVECPRYLELKNLWS